MFRRLPLPLSIHFLTKLVFVHSFNPHMQFLMHINFLCSFAKSSSFYCPGLITKENNTPDTIVLGETTLEGASLPTPFLHREHGHLPELLTDPVSQSPLLLSSSYLSEVPLSTFHFLNFSICSSILSAIRTRSSAYKNSCGHPDQHNQASKNVLLDALNFRHTIIICMPYRHHKIGKPSLKKKYIL